MTNKKYRGYDKEKDTWENFECDNPKDATPETTGYDKVEENDEI